MPEMQFPYIVNPNVKGQIVLPKALRDEYSINEQTLLALRSEENSIVIHVIQSIKTKPSWTQGKRQKLLRALKDTQGIWVNDKNWPTTRKARSSLEKRAVAKARKCL